MAGTASTALEISASVDISPKAIDAKASQPGDAESRAVLERPTDPRAIATFVKVLDRLNPSAPRSEAFTAALSAVLSRPAIDVGQAEVFALNSLTSEIKQALASDTGRMEFDPATLSLITALLHHRRFCSLFLENVMISLRRNLLDLARAGAAASADQVLLAEAMARHSQSIEYLWDETEEEIETVDRLVAKVTQQIETGAPVSAFDLFLIGAYRPLHAVDAVGSWVGQLGRTHPSALDPTLRLLVFNRLIEDETLIEAITPISAGVSTTVQSQYEDNPYPRWQHLPTPRVFSGIGTYVASSVRTPATDADPNPARILIAGAGTGFHPISVAQCLPNAAVLAIDLSRASLAYATREATARNVTNLTFAQADILKLADVDIEFDLIESVGVLHHMEDPEAGLKALLHVLKPGGHLRLALYSNRARHAVNAAREFLAEADPAPGLPGIRAFRGDLIRRNDPRLVPLQSLSDFYAASEFRDLVMHVQEHQFTLPQIQAMLKRNGLKFLGFCGNSAAALRAMPARTLPKRQRDLEAWHRFEARHPDTFIRMYDFFCAKR